MPNLFANAAAWLAGQMESSASYQAVYTRGINQVTLTVWLGSQILRVGDGKHNLRIERPDADLCFRASRLILGGQLTTPLRGDRVDVTLEDGPYRFEVSPPANGAEPHWRYSDGPRTIIRVHAKQIVIA